MPPPSDPENGEPTGPQERRGLINGRREPPHYGSTPPRQQFLARVVGAARHSWGKLDTIVSSNRVNVLLVLVPFGILSGVLDWGPTTVFILNFLAIIPLAALLSFATEELALEVGETVGGLMNVGAIHLPPEPESSDRFGVRLRLEMLWN